MPTGRWTDMTASKAIHASAVAINGAGVLLLGPSGSGKSDLALRLIDRGAVLICDDGVFIENDAGQPVLRAAPLIAGKLEIRGLGIVHMQNVDSVKLRLCVDLGGVAERMPDAPMISVAGFDVPVIALSAFEASAPLKVEYALRAVLAECLDPLP
jgi:HPr kinase/phosphorylase